MELNALLKKHPNVTQVRVTWAYCTKPKYFTEGKVYPVVWRLSRKGVICDDGTFQWTSISEFEVVKESEYEPKEVTITKTVWVDCDGQEHTTRKGALARSVTTKAITLFRGSVYAEHFIKCFKENPDEITELLETIREVTSEENT